MTKQFVTTWLLTATILALLLPVVPAGAADATGAGFTADRIEVRVPNYVFDPLAQGEPVLADSLRTIAPGAGLRLVQFFGPTQDAWLADLETSGLKILQYYPHYTYLVWGSEAQAEAAQDLDFVRWAGAFHPAYKINRDLQGRQGLVENVDVMFYDDGNVDATIHALETLGAKVIQHYPAQPDKAFYNAVVVLDGSQAADVARLNTVLWLGYSHPVPVLDDEMSSQIVAGNYSAAGTPSLGYQSWLTALGFDGTGVRWATIDTGVDYDHPDLTSRIVAGYNFPTACVIAGQPGSDCANGGHGTHVTGIIGADAAAGFADPTGFKYGLGIAPGYDIVAMNSLSGTAWPPAGGWQEHSKQAVLMNAIGGNNSWTTGEGANHGYQASERAHDLIVLDGNFDTETVEPFVEVFSAGNSGPGASTLTAPKEAKNMIVVAASKNYRAGSIDSIANFSSRGPSVDGRIVPTITAPGEQIASTRNDTGGSCSTSIAGTNALYAYCSGTSMAAPHVSGAIVLITDWWRSFNTGANPSPAMAKALLVNGAVDMGAADIPNFVEGWGRVNVSNVINNGATRVYRDQPQVLTESGQNWALTVSVPDPSKPLKVTVAWSDAPGAVGANPALVNNLDLTVTNGATTYQGNNFTAGWSIAGGAADVKNNLENVYVQNPAGSATITVNAANIAGDAVLGNGDLTDQSFSLVCTNCALVPDYSLIATPATLDICQPSSAQFAIAVAQVLGYTTPVTLSASGNPAGTTASFSANPVTPPGASTLTIGNTAAAAPGSYSITVDGNAAGNVHTTSVGLNVYSTAPAAPTLVAPANGATNVLEVPTFSWNPVAQAAAYSIEVATDAAFGTVVASASGLTSPTWTSNLSLNTSTTHYWRVRAINTCGQGLLSSVFRFTTLVAPGDCAAGATANTIYSEGFEVGAGGWTTGGTGNTWAISATPAYVHSGTQAMHATAPSSISDQRLTSPSITLPTGQNPVTLKFWNSQSFEPRANGCFDGGILEISGDAGATWTQAPPVSLLTDPYDGPISTSWDNPLGGLQAWCGDPQAYLNSIVDISAYAGQTVQFRLRLGTDVSVGRTDGWNVDDVIVQSCRGPALSRTFLPTVRVGG